MYSKLDEFKIELESNHKKLIDIEKSKLQLDSEDYNKTKAE